MTTEQLFALMVGLLVVTAFSAGVSGLVLWVFFSRRGARRSAQPTAAKTSRLRPAGAGWP